ncbi:MAG: hypothetical protein JKY48_10885 [Flavobacteriales bacterium]|nr:hypothetical protein [Flavobacteriales bacterium]
MNGELRMFNYELRMFNYELRLDCHCEERSNFDDEKRKKHVDLQKIASLLLSFAMTVRNRLPRSYDHS